MGMGISRSAFMATTAIVCVSTATPALAQAKSFDVPAQSATTGIAVLGRQADIQLVAARNDTEGKQVTAVRDIGIAHVLTPVSNAQLLCRLLLEYTKFFTILFIASSL